MRRRRRTSSLRAAVCAVLLVAVSAPTTGPAGAAEGEGPRTVFRFDEQVTESSGLVDLGDRVLTINDSGDDAVVYVVDPATGATVGRTTYADEVTDVEALTVGPEGDVWVGDIGDNGGSRAGIQVHRIPAPEAGDRRVEATTYDLAYEEGARDAETLLISPEGRLLVVSKGLFGGQVWQGPERLSEDRPNVLTPVAEVGGLVTDGAWFPDGRHVVLRDYDTASVYEVSEERWRYVDRLDIPDLKQGEGIAVRRDGDLLISSEGQRQPVVEVPLPSWLADALGHSTPRAAGEARSPSDGATEGPPGKGLGALVEGGGDLRRTAGGLVAVLLLVFLAHRFLRLPKHK